ncbi:MAG: hypothetical protein A4E52_01447 [Pelotomaculum sp. PtaB.Bin013]|uniref:Uncharacterized protein n=1 Tax=Pelotomaculum isophthalicicum JI TaxID=947010 RepID=A0A9X4JWG3_9FIRM|nr:hypothetical protein [Pelotomaculum isophthalicicum]MDF9409058.1 hypothetical protein [Pelotomaculum isophthalicicum JI]OPX87021.1 MAG: hypothetical protein A4E52_01447 [Pelotomaculum sp. PtaB.Bin013]
MPSYYPAVTFDRLQSPHKRRQARRQLIDYENRFKLVQSQNYQILEGSINIMSNNKINQIQEKINNLKEKQVDLATQQQNLAADIL